jgi:glucokinase-like ROK family protein
MTTTIIQTLIRERNLSLVLRSIYSEAPMSRANLALFTGLNKSTISSLVDGLLARRLIHEVGTQRVGAGRPGTLLQINPQAGGIIGVELGVDFVSVALMNFVGETLWREKEDANPSIEQDVTIKRSLDLVDQAMNICRQKNLHLLGLGLATAGTVDLNEGVLVYSPNLGWRNVPLKKIFSDHTGLKVFVENDANAAAVAEHLFGVMRQVKDFVFVYTGAGIGGGLFLNGKLYRGHNGFAGEIGHFSTTAEPTQELCHCGNLGCWEIHANQHSIIRRMQAQLDSGQKSSISALMSEQKESSLSISIIKKAADAGDKEAIDSFVEAGRAMGQGIVGIVNIFNPEKIVVGGPLSIAGDYLLPPVFEAVEKNALNETMKRTDVISSIFGSDASLFGAVSVVVEDILSHPSIVERR